jgi:hypothetical protein
MSSNPSHSRVDPLLAWLGLAVGYVVPGGGFLLCGRRARGLAHLVSIGLTFGIGLLLKGAVVWPSWSAGAEDFNLINNFTFIVQAGCGLPALASLWAGLGDPETLGVLKFLAGDPPDPYFELGAYFLIVAGALNLFALGNYFDRIVRPAPRFAEQESSMAPREVSS